MRFKVMSLIVLIVGVGGCNMLVQTAQDAAGDASCAGKACDPAEWLFVSAVGSTVETESSTLNVSKYELTFASLDNPVRSASINQNDLTLATVTRDGVLHLSAFGSAVAGVQADLGARAVGWSNAGDRLAVIVGDADSGQAVLIVDAKLNVQRRIDAGLLTSETSLARGVDSYSVSWNPNDQMVAVASLHCAFVSLADGVVTSHDGVFFCYFVASDELVAESDSGARHLVLQDGQVVVDELIDPLLFVLNSHPPTGVFVAGEEGVFPVPVSGSRTTLRMLDAGPATAGGASFPNMLVPLETAQPILEARGLLMESGG